MLLSKKRKAKVNVYKTGEVFIKLMNKAFCDKTIENVYNRQDVEIVNIHDSYNKIVKEITFEYVVQ